MTMRKSSTNIFKYGILIILVVVYLSVCSVTTSPFTGNFYGYDSAFFILVGKGMKYGRLPFRDFFDNKGPWLFVLEWIGQLIWEGKGGAFFLQLINLSLTTIIFDKILCMGLRKQSFWSLPLLFPSALSAVFSIGGGGLTEELCLFPLSLCLLITIDYIDQEIIAHSPRRAFVYGVCFGFVCLVRVTNAVLIGCCVLTVLIKLIVNKQWRNIAENALGFLLGFMTSALPIAVFFGMMGLLGEVINQAFVYASSYAENASLLNGLVIMWNGWYRGALYPLLVGLVVSIVGFRRDPYLSLLYIFSTVLTCISVSIGGRNFEHYYVLFVPVVIMVPYMLSRLLIGSHNLLTKSVAVILACCFCLSYGKVFRLDRQFIRDAVMTERKMVYENDIIDASSCFNETNDVFCWTAQPRWYIYANQYPCIKYCGWFDTLVHADSEMETKIKTALREKPPQFFVLDKTFTFIPGFVNNLLEECYTESYQNDNFVVYKLTTMH